MNGIAQKQKGFATMPTTIATMPTITTTTTQVPNIHPTTSFTFKGNAISPLSCNANGSLGKPIL
jgi:hypothetical protein